MSSASPLFSDPVLSDQIAHMEEWPPRKAAFQSVREPMHESLREKLLAGGIEQLFTHQAEAYDAFGRGDDVIVTTGTNSGKTLCYNLPALQTCLTEPAARCMFLFPTKALAQDQLARLNRLIPAQGIRAATYDGDTPKGHRPSVRKLANIVLTNPDMVHVGILPSHEYWSRFIKSLRLIVLDEIHVYRGVFGSHVGCVLRRLLRLCEWHKATPQIIACSATIGNPGELFRKLTGRTGTLIDQDGSPSGKRTFVFWNPPQLGEGNRLSPNVVTSEILSSLADLDQRTLAFSRSRVSAELVLRYARRKAERSGGGNQYAIESYRAGYTPKERREIETALFSGKLKGLSATNAMELGVDVGTLDAVIMNGYPGSSSSFWQQAGRAGRGQKDGIAIFVAHEDPLEQFLIRKPELLLEARTECISVNPENPQILSGHLICAAYERPMAPTEIHQFGDTALDVAESLDRSGELTFRRGLFYYPAVEPPAGKINIRGAGTDTVRLLVNGEELATMERWRAMNYAHCGAIYLHRGATYLVEELDLEANIATVQPANVDYYTRSVVRSLLDPGPPIRATALDDADISFGSVRVTDLVEEYRRLALEGGVVLGVEPLELPPQTYETVCVRLDLPNPPTNRDAASYAAGVHAAEHALMAVAPLTAGCDGGDLGSAWYAVYPDTMRPAVFVFDRTPGGVGLCEHLYASAGGWLKAALQILTSCDCQSGCPGCLLSARCEAGNEFLDKPEAIRILTALAG